MVSRKDGMLPKGPGPLPSWLSAADLDYYGADGAERIATRQRLAGERGISINALRNRALRLREALEDCVRKRLGPVEAP